MDLIRRQDAIDAFTSKYSSLDFMEDGVIELYVETIDKLPSAQQWIPCSERLPEDDRTVLVTLKWDSDDYEVTVGVYWHDSPTVHGWGNFERYVIAWMPLPAPYKGD